MTPARLAASRRNALKSTGPRTERGKIQSSLNNLRSGRYSPRYRVLWGAFLQAPGVSVDEIARILLTPEEARHPLFAERLDSLREVQIEIGCGPKRPYRKRKVTTGKAETKPNRSEDVIENNRSKETNVFGT